MKRLIIAVILIIAGFKTYAQNNISYNVRWNNAQNRYEVYARPNFTQNNYGWGSSQVGIVTPSTAPNSISVTSANVSGWSVNSFVFAPTVQPANDFFGVSTTGSTVNLVANTEVLLFSFIFQGGQCVNGVRLFINGTDPNSSAAGMNGGDFQNYVYNTANVQNYSSNYNNTGTLCNSCSIVAPELTKQ